MQSRLEVAVVPRRGSALADQTCAHQLVQDALARIAEQNVHAAFLQILRSLLQGLDTGDVHERNPIQADDDAARIGVRLRKVPFQVCDGRSEERRVGKAWCRMFRSWWSPYH